MFQELYNVALENVQRASVEERQRCGQRLAVISKVRHPKIAQEKGVDDLSEAIGFVMMVVHGSHQMFSAGWMVVLSPS